MRQGSALPSKRNHRHSGYAKHRNPKSPRCRIGLASDFDIPMRQTEFKRVEHCTRCSKPIVIRYRGSKAASLYFFTETISCPWCGHNWTLEIPGNCCGLKSGPARPDPDPRFNRRLEARYSSASGSTSYFGVAFIIRIESQWRQQPE